MITNLCSNARPDPVCSVCFAVCFARPDSVCFDPVCLCCVLVCVTKRKTGLIEKMKEKIDSASGRHIYSQRLGTVEPVFGHITEAIGIKRFSLRGKKKVNAQWRLMGLIHNLFKIHRYGSGFA